MRPGPARDLQLLQGGSLWGLVQGFRGDPSGSTPGSGGGADVAVSRHAGHSQPPGPGSSGLNGSPGRPRRASVPSPPSVTEPGRPRRERDLGWWRVALSTVDVPRARTAPPGHGGGRRELGGGDRLGDGVERWLLGGRSPELGPRHGACSGQRGQCMGSPEEEQAGGLLSRGLGTRPWPDPECLLT